MTEIYYYKPCKDGKYLYNLLIDLMKDAYKLEILSGFNSDGAIALLGDDLQKFLISGGVAKFYFPMTPKQTSYDLIKSLLHYDNAEVYGIKIPHGTPGIIHSKVYLFYYKKKPCKILIGSANFTLTGLMKNYETMIITDITFDNNRIIRELGDFELLRITSRNLERLKNNFGSDTDHRGRNGETELKLLEQTFPCIEGRELLLEKRTYETGGGGQIQIPLAAFREFFRSRSGIITLNVNGLLRNVTLSEFGNSTYRIAIREIRNLRQAIVVLREEKLGSHIKTYKLKIISGQRANQLLADPNQNWSTGLGGRKYKIIS